MRAKGRIRVRRKGMSKGAGSFDAAGPVFSAPPWSFARPASIFDAILHKCRQQTCWQRRGEVAERLKAAVC